MSDTPEIDESDAIEDEVAPEVAAARFINEARIDLELYDETTRGFVRFLEDELRQGNPNLIEMLARMSSVYRNALEVSGKIGREGLPETLFMAIDSLRLGVQFGDEQGSWQQTELPPEV